MIAAKVGTAFPDEEEKGNAGVRNTGVISVAGESVFCPSKDLMSIHSFEMETFYPADTPNDEIYKTSVDPLVERVLTHRESSTIFLANCAETEKTRTSLGESIAVMATSALVRRDALTRRRPSSGDGIAKPSLTISIVTFSTRGECEEDVLRAVTSGPSERKQPHKIGIESKRKGTYTKFLGVVQVQINSPQDVACIFEKCRDRSKLGDGDRRVVVTLTHNKRRNKPACLRIVCIGDTNIDGVGDVSADSPFRSIVQDSRRGATHCAVVASVSPSVQDVASSLTALTFAKRIKSNAINAIVFPTRLESPRRVNIERRDGVSDSDAYVSARALEGRPSVFDVATIENVRALSSSQDEIIDDAKSRQDLSRPFTPPPGSIRREGLKWVAHYTTSNNEDHYIGTFSSREEATRAFYERASYYSQKATEAKSARASDDDMDSSDYRSLKQFRKLLRRHAVSGGQLFNYMDSKRSGNISIVDFKRGLAMTGLHPSHKHCVALFREMDRDNDGIIRWDDMMNMINKSSPKARKAASTELPPGISEREKTLTPYQKRLMNSSIDQNDVFVDNQANTSTENGRQERHVRETSHRRSSAVWLQSLRGSSPSSSSRSCSPKSRRLENTNVNVNQTNVRQEGHEWVATIETSDGENHYVGTYSAREIAHRECGKRANYYRRRRDGLVQAPIIDTSDASSSQRSTTTTAISARDNVVDNTAEIKSEIGGDDDVNAKESIGRDEHEINTDTVARSDSTCDASTRHDVEGIEIPSARDDEVEGARMTTERHLRESPHRRASAVWLASLRGASNDPEKKSQTSSLTHLPASKQTKSADVSLPSDADDPQGVIAHLRQTLADRQEEIKNFEIYRDVVEASLCSAQHKLTSVTADREALAKQCEKLRTTLRRKNVQTGRLRKQIKTLQDEVDALKKDRKSNRAALARSEDRQKASMEEMDLFKERVRRAQQSRQREIDHLKRLLDVKDGRSIIREASSPSPEALRSGRTRKFRTPPSVVRSHHVEIASGL